MWKYGWSKRAWLLIFLFLIPVFLNGCYKEAPSGVQAPLKVAATIMPLADIARQIGGEKVQVVTLLPPGASPHTYEPTPAQVKALAGTSLILKIGAGLDDWIGKVATSAAPEAKILTLSQGLELIPEKHEHRKDAHEGENGSHEGQNSGPMSSEHSAFNPHIWLDPVLMRDHLGPAVAQALAELVPPEKDYFMNNLKLWQEKLTRLDADIRSALKGVPQRYFISFHPAWSYFARRYDLIELEVVEEKPGQEPTASHLANLVEKARVQGQPPILIEPQFNPQAAQVVAQEYGGRLYTVDPVGANLSSYLDLMYYNLRIFKEALSGGGTN